MKQFLPLPILFLILPEVKQFFFCYTRCPNGNPLLRQRLGVNQKLLQGHPTAIFGKISVRIFEHLQNGIIARFKRIFTLKKAT